MKWIGQHIYDLVARFRNDVYLEDLSTTTETNVLVVDSTGKVSKNTTTVGDITGITSGSNITVTDPTGPVPTVALSTNVDVAGTLDVTSLGTFDASVTVAGNVGIGTTSPSSLLHISSGTSGDATLIIEADTDNNNENDNPKLQFRQDGGLVYASAGITGDAGTVFTNSLMNATYLGSESDIPLQLFTNSSAKLTILNNGNVGIGTTAPLGKLDIVGRDLIVGDARGGDGESRIFLIEGESGVPNSLDYGFSMAYSGRGTMLGLPSNTFGIVRHDNDATGVAALVIQRSTGNVGIGTTSPAQKLDVVGKISLKDAGDSIFVGYEAGLNDDASANRNVGVGYQALRANTTAAENTAVGYQALYSNTTGDSNTAHG
jgi:hypothetical protein